MPQQRIFKPAPVRGLVTAVPPDRLEDTQSPAVTGIRFRFNRAVPAPGRSILSGPVTTESPQWFGQFYTAAGLVWSMMLTDTKLYRWGNSSPATPRQWHQVLPGSTTPSAIARWSAIVGEDQLFFAREGDSIYRWDGLATSKFFPIVATSGTVPKSRYLEYFSNRLVTGYTFEGGSTFPSRIRWSESGNYTRWDDTIGLGAGFLELIEEGDESITGLRALVDELAVYTPRSIKHVFATGTLAPVFASQTRVRAVGCAFPYSIANAGQTHFFLGYDAGIYSWNGIQLQEIGAPIRDLVEPFVDLTHPENYLGATFPHRNEYWLLCVANNVVFIYDYRYNTWTMDTVPAWTAFGECEDIVGSQTWQSIVGAWNTFASTNWIALAGMLSAVGFAGRTGGATMMIDETSTYDYFAVGSIMDRFLETPDYYLGGAPSQTATLTKMVLTHEEAGFDSNIIVRVSVDRGKTWQSQTVTLTKGYTLVFWNITGNVFRFSFGSADANTDFAWTGYELEYVEAGDYIGSA